jgi:hypothetical protein
LQVCERDEQLYYFLTRRRSENEEECEG